MKHVSDSGVNKQINRFIRNENKTYDLARIISIIMQQSFSNLTLAKLDKQSALNGYRSAIIDEVSKASLFELLNREITSFDTPMINRAWKLVYAKGVSSSPNLH
ncbi:hypothetical protein [Shewanella aestuarii]|uniref:Uncharacterized protein n=1 Tax=Shewanella aestuarii TaxID=1028752 RepID=A0A6G9QQS5_9GAMM|nr:hypothetical protein [Shewanella aestuarii]QIR16453.1 hypothetical protein HBH39_18450 [Shewanella aestuarii]